MKCLALLTCEKIIIDKDGAHSIINVMLKGQVNLQQIQAGQSPHVAVPSNAVTPMNWFIYSLWSPSSDDVGKSFEQVYQVFWPNGDKLTENRLPFTQKDDDMHQVTFSFFGFPVGQQGRIRVFTWLDSGGHRASDMIETYVQLSHAASVSQIPATSTQ